MPVTPQQLLDGEAIDVITVGPFLGEGPPGPIGAAGTDGDTFLDKPDLSPIYYTDKIPVVRDGQIYLATVLDILLATGSPTDPGTLDFSDPSNSAFIGVL